MGNATFAWLESTPPPDVVGGVSTNARDERGHQPVPVHRLEWAKSLQRQQAGVDGPRSVPVPAHRSAWANRLRRRTEPTPRGTQFDVDDFDREFNAVVAADETPDTAEADVAALRQAHISFFYFLSVFREERNATWWRNQFAESGITALDGIESNGYTHKAASLILDNAMSDPSTSEHTKLAAVALQVPWPPRNAHFDRGRSVTFYDEDKPYWYLGNFPTSRFTLDGIRYCNSETAFQYLKFVLAGYEKTRAEDSKVVYDAGCDPNRGGRKAFNAANDKLRTKRIDFRNVWRIIRNWVMFRVVFQKFRENSQFKTWLFTEIGDDDAITEVTVNDNYWAVPPSQFRSGVYVTGDNGNGNWLGRTHVWVRRFLMHLESQSQ